MPTPKRKKPASRPRRPGNPWEAFPELGHLTGQARQQMEVRRRHRAVRYGLFRLQDAVVEAKDVAKACRDLPPGFADFWLAQVPAFQLVPGQGGVLVTESVPAPRARTVEEWGGYREFAKLWDVDAQLQVYLRHSSIWQEWNATLMRVVPVLGEH